MNTLVITTPNNKERSANVTSQFEKQSFKYTRHEFVQIEAIMMSSQPAVGIMQSFQKAVLYAKMKDWETVAIFEDDVNFLIPRSLEMFFDIWNHYKPFQKHGDILLGGIYEGKLLKFSENVSKIDGKFSGLHATIIPKKTYNLILEAQQPYNLDHWLSTMSKANVFVCDPMLIMQKDGYSFNAKCETAYNKMIHKKYNLISYDNTKTD